MSREKLIAAAEATVRRAQQELAFLRSIPADIALESVVRVHDQWCVKASGPSLAALMRVFAPSAIRVERDAYGAPTHLDLTRAPTPDDVTLPFWRYESDLRWLSRRTPDEVVQVSYPCALPELDDFTWHIGGTGTYFTRPYQWTVAPVAALAGHHADEAAKEAAQILKAYCQTHITQLRWALNSKTLTSLLQVLTQDPRMVVSIRETQLRAQLSREGSQEHIRYSFWVSCDKWHEGLTLEFPAVYAKDGFDSDYPREVEYVGGRSVAEVVAALSSQAG